MKNTIKLNKTNGFTLVEILVVVTIISLMASVAAVSYSRFIKQSRDARRKTDIEQIRAAIELYRNFKGVYPASLAFDGTGTVEDGATKYMTKVPSDPLYTGPLATTYSYASADPFQTYVLCAYLEGGSTTSITTSCGSQNCNYCMGPYGQE
jgi:general secretion pathway protein G